VDGLDLSEEELPGLVELPSVVEVGELGLSVVGVLLLVLVLAASDEDDGLDDNFEELELKPSRHGPDWQPSPQ
jgi:hypothetical protein